MLPVRVAAHLPKAVVISLVVSVVLLAGAASATTGADDSKTPKPKASSFAPHPTGRRVYGAPIQRPILHKRHKPGASASKASPAKTGGQAATAVPPR
jgi:hypothetical protein